VSFSGGGPEAERLARPAVELAGDLVEFWDETIRHVRGGALTG
jgi:hypothetical protein